MTQTISLFTNSLDEDQQQQLGRALRQFHSAQQAIRLEERGTCSLPLSDDYVDVSRFFATPGSNPRIVVTGRRLSDRYFTRVIGGCALITVADWRIAFLADKSNAPAGAPDADILASLALTTSLILAGCNDHSILHEETMGCLFDWCKDKTERALKMRAAYVCAHCTEKLARLGVSSIDVDAIHAVLERVRMLVLGRRPQSTVPESPVDDDAHFVATASLPSGVSLPPRLIEACRDGRLTVIVGSGMSLQADVSVSYPDKLDWRSLPAWSEVPRRLSECVKRYTGRTAEPRDAISPDELLADLDYFRRALGENVYYPRAIFDVFSPHVESPGRANRLLFQLPTQWLLTTNYDFVLQYAAPPGTPVYTWRESRQAREYLAAGRGRRPLLKMHGCASRPDTVVLTSLEYERLRQSHEYVSLLRFVFDSHAMLFVGFGFADPFDLDLALQEARLAGAAEGEKFALLPEGQSRQVREAFPQVQTITYEDHSSVASIIAVLKRESQGLSTA